MTNFFSKIFKWAFKFLLCFLIWSCQRPSPDGKGTVPPNHNQWDELLKKHVSLAGVVDYDGFVRDKKLLEGYLELLSDRPPDRSSWSQEEQLAYWINAYNAFTVKLIVDHYPLQSIRDLHPKPYVPGFHTVWHLEFFEIGGQPASLDMIEHGVLREEFDEPRIHFAINCASVSCPPLRNEAYTANKIHQQMDDQAVIFLNHAKWNQTEEVPVKLSKIFKWFRRDFVRKGSLRDYLNQYLKTEIPDNATITYMEYDWRLNDR